MEKYLFNREITSIIQKTILFIGVLIGLQIAYIFILGTLQEYDEGLGFDVSSFSVGLFFLLASILAFSLSLIRQGILITPKELYYSLFLFRVPIYKRKIHLINRSDISVLTSGYRQKYTYAYSTIHDVSSRIEIQEIYLLNKDHTKKTFIIASEKIEDVKKIVKIIKKTLNLKYKKYSPPRSIRRRR